MKFLEADNLACPIDGQVLHRLERNLQCPAGHNFDIARQGHSNLLLVQHKSSRDPGDSKEMVAARKRFLQTGAYEPLAMEIAILVKKLLNFPGTDSIRLLDAGCGEGYYLRFIQEQLNSWENVATAQLIGLDISKHAVHAAASGSNRQLNWVVASNKHPPFRPESLNLIVCAFGFPCFDEFSQVLKPGGKIILVDPGPNHLIEMRRLLYAELTNLDKEPIGTADIAGFQRHEAQCLSFQAEILGTERIHDLLMMTPHYFRTNKEGKANLTEKQKLTITAEINLTVLSKL